MRECPRPGAAHCWCVCSCVHTCVQIGRSERGAAEDEVKKEAERAKADAETKADVRACVRACWNSKTAMQALCRRALYSSTPMHNKDAGGETTKPVGHGHTRVCTHARWYGTQAKVAVETKELEGKTIENDAEFAAGMKTRAPTLVWTCLYTMCGQLFV